MAKNNEGCSDRFMGLFWNLFVNREDIYAIQYVWKQATGYRAVRKSLTRDIVAEHLRGNCTIGFYALSEKSTAKWFVVDVDSQEEKDIRAVIAKARELGFPKALIEFSGRRGYHAWWFFKNAVSGWQARKLGLAITGEHEVFPKQGKASRDTSSPGSLIKAPLGIHQVSSKWSYFLDVDLCPVVDPWNLLASVEKVDIAGFEPLTRRNRRKSNGRYRRSATAVRPCIERQLREGAVKGKRNETGHVIACEMRMLQRTKQETAGVLACWNLRNSPSLSRKELHSILESAFDGDGYSYGCGAAGRLGNIVNCIGKNKCEQYGLKTEDPENV